MTSRGSATQWAILIVIALLAGAMLWALWPTDKNFEQATGLIDLKVWQEIKERVKREGKKLEESVITAFEKAQIEAWIIENDLNKYGDPKDTLYAGGTPLFNEMTGETTDRFDYILSQHPDKPWRK